MIEVLTVEDKRRIAWIQRLQIHYSCSLAGMYIPCRCIYRGGEPFNFLKCPSAVHTSWVKIFGDKNGKD